MRVLVTGAGGQLGQELTRADWGIGVELLALGSRRLDITDQEAVRSAVADYRPGVVVNAAAFTAVDAAEDQQEQAMLVNGTSVGHLVDAANRVGALAIQISSDYVFDGAAKGWYREGDQTGPLSNYGRSKLAGEEAMAKAEKGVTLRTGWVYSAHGSNFAKTIRHLLAEQSELSVVGDQIGCPTSAKDLAAAIVEIARWSDFGRRSTPRDLYHLAGSADASWYEFAVGIAEAYGNQFADRCRQISTDQYPTAAARPANSRLDCSRIKEELGITMAPWQESLPAVTAELGRP